MGNANKRTLKLSTSKKPATSKTPGTPTTSNSTPAIRASTRWSDIAAGRKSTHPDTAPVKLVLDVFELTQHVLSFLSVMDSLRVRRVCRSFRDVFDQSPKLRHAAFLKADPSFEGEKWVRTADDKLLVGEKAYEYIASREEAGLPVDEFKPLRINLMAFRPPQLQPSVHSRVGDFFRTGESILAAPDSLLRVDGPINRKSSCRSMFLTQPPTTKVRVTSYGLKRYPDWEDRRGLPKFFEGKCSVRVIEKPGGVTVADVRTVVEQQAYLADRGRASLSSLTFLDGLAVTAEEVDEIEEQQRKPLEEDEEASEDGEAKVGSSEGDERGD